MSVELCLSRLKKRRKVIGTIIPIVFVQVAWWAYMLGNTNLLGTIFLEKVGDYGLPRYIMSIVMVCGSMIAGATSEGGASVAFPVMTLELNITQSLLEILADDPNSWNDSCCNIHISMNVLLERNTIVWVSIGGAFGVIVGLECIAPILPPHSRKCTLSIWAAFALSLYYLNIIATAMYMIQHKIGIAISVKIGDVQPFCLRVLLGVYCRQWAEVELIFARLQ